MAMAVAVLSLVLVLDHRFLLGLPTARNFRKAASHLVNDPETLRTLEEDAGLKFLPVEEYDAMTKGLATFAARLERARETLEAKTKELDELREEYRKHEGRVHETLPKLGLDRFCEKCQWSRQKVSCLGRVFLLRDKYDTPKFDAMLSAMEGGKCRKSDDEMEKERGRTVERDVLLADWDLKKADFCRNCRWDPGGATCAGRVEHLFEFYSIPRDRAAATLLFDSPRCNKAFRAEEDAKLSSCCGECLWANGMTCEKRVEFLMHTYKNTKRSAMLSALEKPQCVRKK